tara:strand:- start:27 stop:539 length:513 start_codon:yes stop_codon:yes gene_type:complete
VNQKNQISSSISFTNAQLYGLVALRVLIGWHILYEGIAKLVSPYWSSAGFLLDSKWIFSGLAKTIVSNPTLLTISDYGNMWGLTIIGLLLMIGLFNRYATLAGMILILSYYLFSPPFVGLEYSRPGEGSYITVNKNLIEACALLVLYYLPTSHLIGLDRLIYKTKVVRGS